MIFIVECEITRRYVTLITLEADSEAEAEKRAENIDSDDNLIRNAESFKTITKTFNAKAVNKGTFESLGDPLE